MTAFARTFILSIIVFACVFSTLFMAALLKVKITNVSAFLTASFSIGLLAVIHTAMLKQHIASRVARDVKSVFNESRFSRVLLLHGIAGMLDGLMVAATMPAFILIFDERTFERRSVELVYVVFIFVLVFALPPRVSPLLIDIVRRFR